jgi:hypothetical protein
VFSRQKAGLLGSKLQEPGNRGRQLLDTDGHRTPVSCWDDCFESLFWSLCSLSSYVLPTYTRIVTEEHWRIIGKTSDQRRRVIEAVTAGPGVTWRTSQCTRIVGLAPVLDASERRRTVSRSMTRSRRGSSPLRPTTRCGFDNTHGGSDRSFGVQLVMCRSRTVSSVPGSRDYGAEPDR